jgi:hypothetical protein
MQFTKTLNPDALGIKIRYDKLIYITIQDRRRVLCGLVDFDYTLKKEKPDFDIAELDDFCSAEDILTYVLSRLVEVEED